MSTAVSTLTMTESSPAVATTPTLVKPIAVKPLVNKRGGSGTTRCLKAEAQRLINQRSYPLKGKALSPTLEELKSTTFSDYVRHVVLKDNDDDDDVVKLDSEQGETSNQSSEQQQVQRQHDTRRKKLPNFGKLQREEPNEMEESSALSPFKVQQHAKWSEGMAKVTMPQGWWSENGIAQDRTARGPGWQAGTCLGDKEISEPIQQVVAGIGGIYEYTLLDRPKVTVSEFRTLADNYRMSQVGSIVSNNVDDDDIMEDLARKFWKRLGPTMPPAMYGADMEGSLFEPDAKCYGWNLSQLDSCLQVLATSGHVPGVTTPYLYIGMWASVFCAHTEDMNLLSINYLHAGAPKIWYAVAAGEDSRRFECLCESHFAHARRTCPEYLRHKRYLLSPTILLKAGIPFTMHIQRPGDAIITFPGSYHFGFNTGFNVAEATNFAVPEWIPFGLSSRVCLCRHDSVRIDMKRFHHQLELYEKDRRRAYEMGCKNWITWREWSALQAKRKRQRKEQITAEPLTTTITTSSDIPHATGSCENCESADQQSQPQKPAKKKRSTTNKLSEQQRKREFWVEVMQPVSSERKGSVSQFRKRRKSNNNGKRDEVWHLAKPVIRRLLKVQTRVLCIVPVAKSAQDDDDSDDEECFRGSITEMSQDHVRVHFDGLQRKEDMWIPMNSPKLFMDGGQWSEEVEIPVLHYWQEEDSKKKCL